MIRIPTASRLISTDFYLGSAEKTKEIEMHTEKKLLPEWLYAIARNRNAHYSYDRTTNLLYDLSWQMAKPPAWRPFGALSRPQVVGLAPLLLPHLLDGGVSPARFSDRDRRWLSLLADRDTPHEQRSGVSGNNRGGNGAAAGGGCGGCVGGSAGVAADEATAAGMVAVTAAPWSPFLLRLAFRSERRFSLEHASILFIRRFILSISSKVATKSFMSEPRQASASLSSLSLPPPLSLSSSSLDASMEWYLACTSSATSLSKRASSSLVNIVASRDTTFMSLTGIRPAPAKLTMRSKALPHNSSLVSITVRETRPPDQRRRSRIYRHKPR
ncbi:hypothetical protein MuHV1_gp034 [Murid betaherpesvirus 1]|uniref:hypothetical protein n=1 Tax=Murid herpesvirus 1 TaxID=10366 RepID=UPI00004EBBDD|nr:hypothetical protein MuHV1_gp034 [Murid betaherpesvirus 1]